MKASALSAREERAVAAVGEWLANMEDMMRLCARPMMPEEAALVEVPGWVRAVGQRLEGTMFAAPNSKLQGEFFTPYRMGYALGLMQWGMKHSDKAAMNALRRIKGPRLSARAKRRIGKLSHDFLVRAGLVPPPGMT